LGTTYKHEMTKLLPFAGGKYFGCRKWEEISSTITSLIYVCVRAKYLFLVVRGDIYAQHLPKQST
jgi:hypothetical protein